MQPEKTRHITISFRLEHLFGWVVIILLCAIPVIVWWRLHPVDAFNGLTEGGLNIGRLTALVGTVLYALNLVLATRLRFIESMFGGLNRVYIAHHVLGGLALIFLLFHPLALAVGLIPDGMKQAALSLLPNGLMPLNALFDVGSDLHAAVLQQWAITFGIVAFWGMVLLLLVTFFIKLPYSLWLLTHKFLGVAFLISAFHILFITSDTSEDMFLKYYMLSIVAVGLLAYVYKTLLGNVVIRKYRYTIDSIRKLVGGVVQITLKPLAGSLSFKPGQFVFARLVTGNGKSGEWHPFSISSAPTDGTLQLSIKGLGDYTNKLINLEPGMQMDLEGAYGRFSYTNYASRDQIWVAGGIGITPFLSMMKDLPPKGYRVHLFYSVKSESEMIDWPLMYQTMYAKPESLRVVPYVVDQQAKLLDVDYIEQISGELQAKDFYLCGPPAMMSALKRQLKARGVPGVNIHSEEFAMS